MLSINSPKEKSLKPFGLSDFLEGFFKVHSYGRIL